MTALVIMPLVGEADQGSLTAQVYQFPLREVKGAPREPHYCEQAGCIHGFSAESSCAGCVNWERDLGDRHE